MTDSVRVVLHLSTLLPTALLPTALLPTALLLTALLPTALLLTALLLITLLKLSYCGASFSLRGALAPPFYPGTRPSIQLRTCHKPCFHWIPQNIILNLPELPGVPDNMIITLMLPKRTTRPAQNQIRFTCGRSLDTLHKNRRLNERSRKHVDMIGHDHPSVQSVIHAAAALDDRNDQVCNLGHPQVQGSMGAAIQKPVKIDEHLAGGGVLAREVSALRKAVLKPESDE